MSQRNDPGAFNLMMQIIAESWVHGRQSPALMAIPFETEWARPIEDIRSRYGVSEFTGSFPPDLFEQLKSASENEPTLRQS